MVGETIDRYLLLEKIGSGGMGDVYKARHATLEQYRAIKILPPYLAASDELVQRFFREARRCAALEHPNLVRLEHAGEQDGHYYMVMDFVDGEDLRRLIDARASIPPDLAVGIARDVCRGLDYAHSRGVIHRDVKPSNILISRDGCAVLTDFGIARGMEGDEPGLTAAGAVLGTPEYMSPEQVRGEPVDGRSDLYSLGIVLYEMCTGELPFTARSAAIVRRFQVERFPEPPSFLNPSLPPALDAVIMRALAKNPAERFASAADMEEALDAALRTASDDESGREEREFAGTAAGRNREQGRYGGAVAAPEGERRSALTLVDGAGWPGPGEPRRLGRERGGDFFERPTLVSEAPAAGGPSTRDTTLARLRPYLDLLNRWGSRRRLPAILGAVTALVLAAIALQALGGAPGPRFRAETGWDPRNGREFGTVLANDVPVFIVTTPQGDLSPGQRAERAAQQLRRLEERHSGNHALTPDQIVAMNTARGETILAHRHADQRGAEPDPDDVIVNVDDTTARTYAGVGRMALASWWRDLLRDQIRLSRGREPVATYDTPTGTILDHVYQAVVDRRYGKNVSAADLKKAVNDLPEAERTALRNAWRKVPAGRKSVTLAAAPGGDALLPRWGVTATDEIARHPVEEAIDGNEATSWQTGRGLRVDGRLHALRVRLARPATVTGVEVLEGQVARPEYQLHVRRARLRFPDGSSVKLARDAAGDPLQATFPPRRASWVRVEFEDVFPNQEAGRSHLAVAEVRVWGR